MPRRISVNRWAAALILVPLAASTVRSQARIIVNPYDLPAAVVRSGYWGYVDDPYGLHGAADLVRAQGQYRNLYQEALKKKIENQHRRLELWLWKREHLPTTEDDRERRRQILVQRSRIDPPEHEIWSGTALNVLLKDLQLKTATLAAAEAIPLNQETLGHIHVTHTEGLSVGLLKRESVFRPFLFRFGDFAPLCDQIDELWQKIRYTALKGDLDAASMRTINDRLKELESLLNAKIKRGELDRDVSRCSAAIQYIRDVRGAVQGLEKEGASKYFTGAYAAAGQNVRELIENMTAQGLVFDRAYEQDKPAYRALHRLLAQAWQAVERK